MQLALIGDSILDNDIYVSEGKSIYDFLKLYLPQEFKLTKLAIDGATSDTVKAQLENIPESITHIVISIGGNDALKLIPLLDEKTEDLNSALSKITPSVEHFRKNFSFILKQLSNLNSDNNLNLYVLNIYNSIPKLEIEKKLIISIFNDVISEEATRLSIPIIDLRSLLIENSDFSTLSPLEPSEIGGNKIAKKIMSKLNI